jgi:hypothetical protein
MLTAAVNKNNEITRYSLPMAEIEILLEIDPLLWYAA